MNNVQALETRFGILIAALDDAQDKALSGQIMDLKALHFESERLCAEVLRQEPETARSLQPLIGDVIGRLDALERTLIEFKERIQS